MTLTELSGLLATLLACLGAQALSQRLARWPALAPLLAPPLLAMLMLIGALLALHVPYTRYAAGARPINLLLGPATVALAIPIHAQLGALRRRWRAVVPALLAGSVATIVSALWIARRLGAPRLALLSLAPKSVTAPIAVGIAARLGGDPSLTAAMVMATAMVALPVMGPLFRALRVTDPAAQGLAAGTIAHGLGTARMLALSEQAGAFASLAIGLNGVASALMLPALVRALAG